MEVEPEFIRFRKILEFPAGLVVVFWRILSERVGSAFINCHTKIKAHAGAVGAEGTGREALSCSFGRKHSGALGLVLTISWLGK